MSFLNFLFVAFSLTSISFSQIITTESIDGVKEQVAKADESTLVIFDCDDVLTHYTDSALSKASTKALEGCVRVIALKYPDAFQNFDKFKLITMSSSNQILVNNEMPCVVLDLQKRGIKTVVLTAMKNKNLEDGSFIDLRIKKLADFGFDFSKGWEDIKEVSLMGNKETPYYKSGIVCSGPVAKSVALDLFLKHSRFKPKKIVFIDDSLDNLEDVKNWANKSQIEFVGVEYLEYKKIPYEYPFSEKRVIFQLERLVTAKKWLSDKEAEEIMKSE